MGQYYYYLYNGHRDVVQIVAENGSIVNSYENDEWGNILSKTEQIANPLRYAGEYYDEETGLYYLRARYYDPSVGRFISQDKYEGDITNPLTINLYTYVANNPLRYWDPSGYAMEGDNRLGLSREDQREIARLSNVWAAANKAGNKAAMQQAHDDANKIRLGYTDAVKRVDFETGTTSYVVKTAAVKGELNVGVGFGGKAKFAGIGFEAVAASTVFVNTNPIQNAGVNAKATVNAQATNKLAFGLGAGLRMVEKAPETDVGELIFDPLLGFKSGYGTINAFNDDLILSTTVEGYWFIGGGITIDINASEIFRRIFGK